MRVKLNRGMKHILASVSGIGLIWLRTPGFLARQKGQTRGNDRKSKLKHYSKLRTGAFAAILVAGLAACASTPESSGQSDTMSIQGQPATAISTPVAVAPPAELPVQTGNINLPSNQLGMLTYDEPYSPRAIDQDHIEEKLRSMAIGKWGNQVDAVVGLTTSLSPDRREVTVEAEGVHVKGDCPFCRRGITATAATTP